MDCGNDVRQTEHDTSHPAHNSHVTPAVINKLLAVQALTAQMDVFPQKALKRDHQTIEIFFFANYLI